MSKDQVSCNQEEISFTPAFSPVQYEDAIESPLEQCISDSMVRSKDSGIGSIGGTLFSLVPSGVPSYKPSQTIVEEPALQPISSPDCFSDFFSLLSGMLVRGYVIVGRRYVTEEVRDCWA